MKKSARVISMNYSTKADKIGSMDKAKLVSGCHRKSSNIGEMLKDN